MRIGEAAEEIGVETHVLRHWEDEGVVVPARLDNGYRDYDDEALTRLRIVLACRRAGMSLEQTRLTLHRDATGREAVIRAELVRVERQRAELLRTSRFLEHVLHCRHSLMSRCPGCSALA
ncbi:Cu(I)-responsive transcriptional regulator [Marmoricola endophyticus]|uniref:Cu(I)-responsive transcriptional regulator n=1 Tax=Marmoricola endophyticus TaxID=2040280 RepID=A0A917F355_9ACTN|nr:MerR family transcriptional regulator [Marmoricola endophyticus]GGF40302.1 Cu(I)-responsive transcriptional regulator [Marmoricola endophyticus]